MSSALIITLPDVRDGDEPRVGGKAMSLARMMRSGLPVPAGFCITTEAWREHARGPAVAAALARSPRAEICRAILDAPLAPLLAEEVVRSWKRLGAPLAAVRSSATDEDRADRSFAGQYDTILGVATVDQCLHAIRRCWASLFSERAAAYRLHHGRGPADVAMAVIVQRLVPAVASGVVFTVDPVSGHDGRLLIEGGFGLGEGVVSGRVAPDRIVLARDGLHIFDRHTSCKRTVVVCAEGGGVREEELRPERAGQASLDDAAARRLGALALRVEETFGRPVDIEWARSAEGIHLLQARPITTRSPRPWEDRQVWTNANAAEALPDVMTPLTQSWVEAVLQEMGATGARWLGLDVSDVVLYRTIAGRPYFNLNSFVGVARRLPGLHDRSVGELLGGQQEFLAVTPSGALDIPEEDIPVLRLRWPRVVLNLPRLLVMALRHSPRRAVRFIERTRAETEAALGGAWRAGTDTELARSIEHRLAEMIVGREAFLYLGVGFGHVLALFTVCHRWFGPEGRSIANRLLAGLGALEHAEAGLGLWRLAASIAARPVLRAALEGAVSLEAFCTSLRSLEGGAALLAEWSRFMRRFGHHGTAGELELATPRWHERPDQVLDMVRHLIMGVGASDPVRRVQAAAQERDRLVADCRRRLRNPLKRAIFDVALRMARRGAPVRENLRNETVRQIALVRLMVLELGRRLVARGALAQDENVFFLRSDEFVPLLGGEITVPVAERRAEYERNRALHPPALIRGRFAGSDRPDAAPRAAARRLEGISASRGVAIGPARVLLRAGDGHVRPGEILVAPFTDPAWAPHFLLAAAIVMDMGGLLSHGAIVAREYGVPCVVNVGPATSLIATGQMIRVDGDRGVVEVLED